MLKHPEEWRWWLKTDFFLLLVLLLVRFCLPVFLLFIGFVHFLMNKLFCQSVSVYIISFKYSIHIDVSTWFFHCILRLRILQCTVHAHIYSRSFFFAFHCQINTRERNVFQWGFLFLLHFRSAAAMNSMDVDKLQYMNTTPKFYDPLNFSFWRLEFHFRKSLLR